MNRRTKELLTGAASLCVTLGIIIAGYHFSMRAYWRSRPYDLDGDTLKTVTLEDGYERGKAYAFRDIERGRERIIIYGHWCFESPFAKHLESKGIEPYAIATCVVNDGIAGFAAGYNKVMGTHLRQRYAEIPITSEEVHYQLRLAREKELRH